MNNESQDSGRAGESNWAELASKAREQTNAHIQRLASIFESFDRIEILARLAVFHTFGPDDVHEPTTSTPRNEAYLEYLISLAAALPPVGDRKFPPPEIVQETIDLVMEIHQLASIYYSIEQRSRTDQRTPIEEIAARFRMSQMHVRGDGYWLHLQETQLDLLRPHSEALKAQLGYDPDDYFRFFAREERAAEARCTGEAERLHRAFHELLREWLPELSGSREWTPERLADYESFITTNEETVAEAKSKANRFGSPMIFRLEPVTELEAGIVESLSTRIGDNVPFHGSRENFRFWPLNDSILGERPILRRDDEFFLFNFPYVQRQGEQILGKLLRERDPRYWEKRYRKSRGEYLEVKTAELFRQAIPSAKVLTSAAYSFGAQKESTEADVVVIADDVLIAVECKSSAIPKATRRGGQKSAEASLERTVLSGLGQAQRLVSEMAQHGALELTSEQETVVLKPEDFRMVFQVVVTLELITPVSDSIHILAKARGLISPDRCWAVGLNDLRVIVEILDEPAVFLHYLKRRVDLALVDSIRASDELDFLMHYVEEGLFFQEGNSPPPDTEVLIASRTDPLDAYFHRKEKHRSSSKRPRPPLGARTKLILKRLKTKHPRHHLSAAIDLLEFDLQPREKFLRKLSWLTSKVRASDSAYSFSVLTGSEGREGIVLAVSSDPVRAQPLLNARLREHCRERGFEELTVILLGLPFRRLPMLVFHVTPHTEVSEASARLLSQLRVELIEHQRPSCPER